MFEKLKKRWKISNNWQFAAVMLVFSITGISTLYARKIIFEWIGITPEISLWIRVPLYILIIFPVYQLLFLIIGSLLGQFRFAWEFEKKMLSRLGCKRFKR